MASTVQVKVTGDSFIRPHLYQPILPFEVISADPPFSFFQSKYVIDAMMIMKVLGGQKVLVIYWGSKL